MKKVSIIIPAFNTERYISKTIESAISQSYSNIEIIIVNDGSVDKTHKIVEEYIKKDSRIKLFSQENQGLSAARNLGIRFARGDVVAFLDSDDWWHPQYLEKMTKLLFGSEKIGIAFSRVQFADENGNLLPIFTRGHVKNIRQQDFYYMNPLSCGSNIVIKKRFLDELKKFDESLKSVEDLEFLFRASSHTFYIISGLKEYLVYYRIRDGLSHDTERMVLSWNKYMQKVKDTHPGEFKKHYLPALLSQNINLARRSLQSEKSRSISKFHLFFCLQHPIAFVLLAFRYPIMAFYTFPGTLIKLICKKQ